MYFVVKGKVEFLFFEGTIPIVYAEVLDGYYFGELDLLFCSDKIRFHTVRAGEVTELLALSSENFHTLLDTFDEQSYYIMQSA